MVYFCATNVFIIAYYGTYILAFPAMDHLSVKSNPTLETVGHIIIPRVRDNGAFTVTASAVRRRFEI